MQLLIVPIVIGLGALLIQNATSRVQIANTLDNQRQDALMTYFDRMETLLLDYGLRDSSNESEVRTTARARTLAVLRTLDIQRKRYTLEFLYESDLISNENPIVKLDRADFREAELDFAHLERASLNGANLYRANLEGIFLEQASLEGANLNLANIERSSLQWANFEAAYL